MQGRESIVMSVLDHVVGAACDLLRKTGFPKLPVRHLLCLYPAPSLCAEI